MKTNILKMTNIKKKFNLFLRKFFVINDTPEKIAGGAALGVFLGMIPGAGVVSALILSSLFKLNRLAAGAGALATSAWMSFIILVPSAFLGALFSEKKYPELIDIFEKNYRLGWEFFFGEVIFFDFTLPLILGFIVVSGIISLGFYCLLLYLLKKHKLSFTKKSALIE